MSDSPRMFEMKEGSSDKFWEITLDGTSHTVRFGRVGTDGQTKTKDYGTDAAAKAAYDKLVKEKTGKGYKEVTGSSGSRQNQAKAAQAKAKDREPFIQAILESPDDPAPYQIFADWLEDQGDPQAELIRLQWQLEDEGVKAAERKKLTDREKALLKEHQQALLGDLADDLINQKGPKDLIYGSKRYYEWQFGRGVLDSLLIEYLLPDFAKLLRKSSHVSTLRQLKIRNASSGYDLEDTEEYSEQEWDTEDAPSLKLLNGTEFPNLRVLEVSEDDDFNCHFSTPSIQNLIKGMPRLESLRVDAHDVNISAIFKLELPHLRSLTMKHTAWRYPLEALGKNESLAQLETLHIYPHAKSFDDDEEGAYLDLKGIQGLFRSKCLPALKHVSLYMCDAGNAGLAEIIKSPLFRQLESLHLIWGTINDEGVELLCNTDLSHLQSLDLTGNYISASGVKSLKKKFPAVKAGNQYSGVPNEEAEYLFNGDIE